MNQRSLHLLSQYLLDCVELDHEVSMSRTKASAVGTSLPQWGLIEAQPGDYAHERTFMGHVAGCVMFVAAFSLPASISLGTVDCLMGP